MLLGSASMAAAGAAAGRAPKAPEGPATARPDKPNIVFILADDMGYECIGAYGSTYRTPNIDRLASTGIRFDYAYSQPLSTPTRVEVMTGRYNHKNYVQFGFMNQDQKTFGHLARMAGYATAIAGKWQLGYNSLLPDHFGFDSYCLWQLSYSKSSGERYADPLIEQNGKTLDRRRDDYGPDLFADFADRFIEQNRDRPFLLYLPMVLVHEPFVSTPASSDWNTNSEGRFKSNTRYFPDMMEYCDRMVGRVVEKLRREGLYDNTLIIFTGDNGTGKDIVTAMKDGTRIRGGKGLTTDAGTHAPLIVAYGARQGRAGVCADLVDMTDVMASMAQAMGVAVPAEWDTDGVSFLPQVTGQKGTPRSWVFCHYDNFIAGADKPNPQARRYIRDHRYKLYSTGEFYDIQRDIFEKESIASGGGAGEAETARAKLAEALSHFPAWRVGDIPVAKVEYPGLKSLPVRITKKER
ncbi:arylsulfatase [Bacteroidia bacterium]|nr:arylsulfatase [Bacteroidia bacterium]